MKRKLLLIAVLALMFCTMSTYAADIDMLKVESVHEILGEDEMQTPEFPSQDATLYSALSGKGTVEEPYEIHTADDLVLFADSINSGVNTKSHYRLMSDIDLKGRVWMPVGYYTADLEYYACFSGTFDGNGHKITNFKINRANSAYVGFFGYIYNGSVKNLTLSDFNIDINSEFTVVYAGGLAGRCIAKGEGERIVLENCKTENASINAKSSGSAYVGGLSGYFMTSDSSAESFVKNCESGVNVFVLSNSTSPFSHNVYAGGLIGYTGATVNTRLIIEKCMSYGSVEATTALDVTCAIGAFGGGICGFSGVSGVESVLSINECGSASKVYVECTSAGYAGGITSYLAKGTGKVYLADCYSTCEISGVTHGITSETNYVIMGLISGAVEPDVAVSTCFVRGSIKDSGSQDSYAGVIVGFDFKTIDGYPFGTSLNNCFYSPECTIDALNIASGGAYEVKDEDAKNKKTYTGFNFAKTWKFFDEGYKYPVLCDVGHVFRINYIVRDEVFESVIARYKDALVLPDKTPDKYDEGQNEYTFSHWSLEFGGDEVENDIEVIDAYTVYAVFEGRYKTFTFTFVNGDAVYDRQNVIYGQTSIEPAGIPSKTSDVNFWYRFKYWSTTPDGTDKTPVSEIVASSDCMFYAIYDVFDHNVWNGRDAREFSAGNGTQSRPYEIRSGYELYYLARALQKEPDTQLADAHYVLCADIDLANNEWLPIGTKDTPFTGVFDGNGYTVKNLKITDEHKAVGIFGFVENAVITGFKIDKVDIDVNNAQSGIYAGAAIGFAGGGSSVSSIGVTNGTLSANIESGIDVGAIIGRIEVSEDGSECNVSDCYSRVDISVASKDQTVYAGQIAGYIITVGNSSVVISNCYSLGNVDAKGNVTYAGALAGGVETDNDAGGTGKIVGCFVLGNVSAKANASACAGDIVGNADDTVEIVKNYSYQEVTVDAESESDNGMVLIHGITAQSGDFRNAEFLSENLGFDFDGKWHFENQYMYPSLRVESSEKPMFSVSNVSLFSGNVTLMANVRVLEEKPYRVIVSVYSERGRLIGIKTAEVNDNSESKQMQLPLALENVKDASYIKITVLDESMRSLLFPTVMKKL